MIAELAEEAEAKLAEEVLAAEALRQEKEALEKEAAEVIQAGITWGMPQPPEGPCNSC